MNKYPNLSLAIEKVFEARVDAFLSQIDPNPEVTLSVKTEKKLLKLARRRDKSYYPLICTAGRRIACIVAVIFVFAISALSIKPVRAAFVEFINEVFPTHTHITTSIDNLSVSSNEIVEHSFSAPDGFKLIQKQSTLTSISSMYQNDNKFIVFNQIKSECYSANYDNESSNIETIYYENDQSYIIITSENSQTIIWKDDEYVYCLKSNISKNELLNLYKQTKIY